MDYLNTIEQLRSPQRPPALVNAVGYLLFREMRIDPTNPYWNRGDRLVYSERFEDTIKDGYQLLGCSPEAVPRGGIQEAFDALRSITYPQRLFALIDGVDKDQFPKVDDSLRERIVVICPEVPLDEHRWCVQSCEDGESQSLAQLFQTSQKPLWIISPIMGRSLLEPSRKTSPPPLADRMSKLGTETAFDVLSQVNALVAQGRDIISFGLGEPDFDTPSHIKEAGKQAIDQNETHYSPSAGIAPLREAIAQYIQRTRRIPVDPEEVVVTPGAKPVMFDVMMALVNPGDEVIYPNPGYPIYESVIDWVGGISVPLPLLEERNWEFSFEDLARLVSPKTKMIVLNTPGNPTGTMLGASLLRDIAKLAVENNIWVIADEVYSQIVFDQEFHSIVSFPGMKERTILVDGFSKTYAMTGWRLGYGVMPRDLAEHIAKIETNIDSCTCTFTQIAGVHALQGPHHESNHMVKQFQERSRVMVDALNNIDGVRCLPAQGAFYVFPNVTGACRRLGMGTANELQQALLEQAGVAVLPRTCFGRKNTGEDQEYLRLSFATSMSNIREGIRRMKQFIER